MNHFKFMNEMVMIFPKWYLISQFSVCLTATFIFWIIYKYPAPEAENRRPKREKGLLFISLAVFIWALSPAITLLFGISSELRIYFSTLNNVFLLLATAFFEYGPRKLRFFQLHERWVWLVICGGLIVASITSNLHDIYWQRIPDVFLSITTIAVLGWAICKSFYHRIFKEAAIIAGIIVLYMIYTQLQELNNLGSISHFLQPTEMELIVLLTSKSLLIMILLLVSLSWIHEQWVLQIKETSFEKLPENSVHIHIKGTKSLESKRRWEVIVTKGNIAEARTMTSKPHLLLVQFMYRKQENTRNKGLMNTIEDSFYHADLSKIHKMLELDVPTLFKNQRRNGFYSLRDNIEFTLDEKELAKDPDLFSMISLETSIPN